MKITNLCINGGFSTMFLHKWGIFKPSQNYLEYFLQITMHDSLIHARIVPIVPLNHTKNVIFKTPNENLRILLKKIKVLQRKSFAVCYPFADGKSRKFAICRQQIKNAANALRVAFFWAIFFQSIKKLLILSFEVNKTVRLL